ncbi:hypothetical protein LINGRAPRIM_LOCUS1406 [Linum grandiflorum]
MAVFSSLPARLPTSTIAPILTAVVLPPSTPPQMNRNTATPAANWTANNRSSETGNKRVACIAFADGRVYQNCQNELIIESSETGNERDYRNVKAHYS